MRQRKIVAILASAVLTVGFSAAISGCADHPPESRPIMYGTNGNRGVTAPSQGVPQNIGNPLGGAVTTTPGSAAPNQTIVGTSAGVDATGAGTVGTNESGVRTQGVQGGTGTLSPGRTNLTGARPGEAGTGTNGQGGGIGGATGGGGVDGAGTGAGTAGGGAG